MTIKARIVCDSISPAGKRLTSVSINAHRFILAEINTHRMLSRSYRSSRAVPVKKLLEEVRNNPAMPVYWGANESGMQASGELNRGMEDSPGTLSRYDEAQLVWCKAAEAAATKAEQLMEIGLHKQTANRVLEPFLYVTGILTATDWDNFFGLRLYKAAQPEFRALADAMWAAMRSSTPKHLEPGEWHLPYVDDVREIKSGLPLILKEGWENGALSNSQLGLAIKVSVARCARNSYRSFDTDRRSTLEEDLATYAKLNIPGTDSYDPTQPIHASPAEHQGTPDTEVKWSETESDGSRRETCYECASEESRWGNPEEHGNFSGWRQYRKMLPGEAVAPLPKEYQA